jgi:NADPH:quinone reductase
MAGTKVSAEYFQEGYSMKAAVIAEGTIGVQDRPDPEPGYGQILVRVRAAGLNNADLIQRRGNYPAPSDSPADIPGLELAGEVLAAGPGTARFESGDRVMAVVGGGGQAELAVIHERLAMPVPDGVDWTIAGGFPETFSTAHDALFSQCGLSTGEHLLVHGGAGGVGTAAIQLGVAAGARVTASVRNPDMREAVAGLGANVIPTEDFGAHGPYDVILELIGAPNMAENLASLATGGRIVLIGTSAGNRAEINLGAIMQKRARILGSTLRARSLEEKALVARRVETQVLPLFAAGRLQVPIAATFPLNQVEAAYERFAAGGKFGKIVLLT